MSKGHAPTSQVYVRFLGEPAGAGTPGAILGLPSGKASEEQIATALRRQLARVDAHPRAFTAEAEGVRQALRDAAVSLMKTGGNVELPWRGPSATGGAESAGGDRPKADPFPSGNVAHKRDRELSVDWESYHPQRKLDPAVIIGGIVFVAVFLVVGLSVVLGTKTASPVAPAPPPPAPVVAAPAAPAQPSTTPSGPTTPMFTPSAAPLAPTDPTLALRQLRGAAGKIKAGDVGAVGEFATALAWLGENWVRLDIGQRRAADDAIVEYLYAAGTRNAAWEGVLGALRDAAEPLTVEDPVGPEKVWPAVFAAGVLQRLSREREFPAQWMNDLARLHIAALGEDRPRQSATFEAGAGAALRRLMPRMFAKNAAASKAAPLVEDVEKDTQRLVDTLARWTEAVASCGLDTAQQEALVADAMEGLMLRGEPEADQGVFAGVQQLALAIKWRRDGAARGRLLAWFDDARLTSSDLSVLTTVLASKSGAEGVDATMALSAGASPMDRQALRQRYAQAWGTAAATAGADASDWFDFARSCLRDEPSSGTLPDDLLAASVLAKVNQAARLLWAGDRAAAASALDRAQRDARKVWQAQGSAQMVTGGGPPVGGDNPGGSGQWAQAYLAQGRHIQNRLAKLTELERRGTAPSGVDAAVLADEACFGSPPEVKNKAQSVVIRFGREKWVLNAVLDSLPRATPSESVSRMIQTLTGETMPKSYHPDWALHARRALVATLVDDLASGTEETTVDAGAKLVIEAYLDVLGSVDPAMPTPDSASGTGDDRAERALAVMWDSLIDKARAQSPNPGAHASLETIEARRRARRSLAAGPVQRWAAEQTAVCDLLAYVTAAERPASKARVRAIMEELATRRRSADTIARQILTTEHAMTLLWVIRLNADGGTGS